MRALRVILGIVLLGLFVGYCYIHFSGSAPVREPIEPPAATQPQVAPSAETTAPTAEPEETPEPTPTPEPTLDPNSPAGRAAALGLPAPPEIDAESWEYVLANLTHDIDRYAPPETGSLTYGRTQRFDSRIIEPMTVFLEAARGEGLSVYLTSGYRDYDTQSYNYRNKCRQYPPDGKDSSGHYIVLPPGKTEHQTGLAADITDHAYDYMNASLEKTKLYQWMSQHCQEYGFIVRYPADKEEITMVMYEPWHFRYVGVEAATYIMENGLCLEEFLQLYGID